jgi:hypothetical protein
MATEDRCVPQRHVKTSEGISQSNGEGPTTQDTTAAEGQNADEGIY